MSEILSILAFITFFIFSAIMAIIYKEYKLLLILLPCIFVYLVLFLKKTIDDIKKNSKIEEFTNTYKFYPTYFKIEYSTGNSKFFYFKIFRLIETKNNFYIYMSKNKAFIVSKNGFINSNPEEFKKFIRKRTLLKYKEKI